MKLNAFSFPLIKTERKKKTDTERETHTQRDMVRSDCTRKRARVEQPEAKYSRHIPARCPHALPLDHTASDPGCPQDGWLLGWGGGGHMREVLHICAFQKVHRKGYYPFGADFHQVGTASGCSACTWQPVCGQPRDTRRLDGQMVSVPWQPWAGPKLPFEHYQRAWESQCILYLSEVISRGNLQVWGSMGKTNAAI